MYFIKEWFETQKSKKDSSWADRVIRNIRMNMQPLVSAEEARIGMEYLLAKQSLKFVEDLFQNPSKLNLADKKSLYNNLGERINRHENHNEFMQDEMRGASFRPLNILKKYLNINIAEMKKMGPVVNVRSEDPTSTTRRKKDEALIKNKKQIESDLSEVYTKIGQRPVSIDHHEARFGEAPGNGNIESFDEMGLDSADPADINQFMTYFHKLKEEIAAQNPIDYCMTYNQVGDKIVNWTTDIWAKNAIGAACHVSDNTGAIMFDYIAPETIWIYGGGRRQDYNDANAKAYEQKITIKELLDRFGNSFDFEKDWDRLLMAITFGGNSIEWTGIKPSWRGFCAGESFNTRGGASYGIDNFMSFKVLVGYVEWTTQNQETFGEVNKDKTKGFYENNQPTDGERYQTKARFETPTYKSFYLAVSAIDQILFNFGEMTYQQIEGYADFNVNFSIVTYKEIGDPLVIMAIPFLDIIHEAWYKWKYELRRAKPPGVDYNYDSLIDIAEDLITDDSISREGKLQQVVAWLDSSANGMWKFPIGPDGKPVMFTGAQLNPVKPNGLSAEIEKWWNIIIQTKDEMQDMLTGKAPLREGDPGNARDSMNNQFKALEYSQNATYFVPDMLTYLFQQLASKTMLFVEDIIQYKNHNTLAYNFLVDAVGERTLNDIKGMGKKSMYRYGIFVESLNQTAQRAKLSARLDFALQNGKILNSEALLIENIKSPTQAYLWLSYFEQKKIKDEQKNAMASQQQQQQGLMQIEQMKHDTEKMKIDGQIIVAQIQAEAGKQEHIIAAQKQITTTAMRHVSDVAQIEAEAAADLRKESQNLDATGKQNIPAPAQQIPPPTLGGPPPAQQRPQSGIQQSIASAQPVGTSQAM